MCDYYMVGRWMWQHMVDKSCIEEDDDDDMWWWNFQRCTGGCDDSNDCDGCICLMWHSIITNTDITIIYPTINLSIAVSTRGVGYHTYK